MDPTLFDQMVSPGELPKFARERIAIKPIDLKVVRAGRHHYAPLDTRRSDRIRYVDMTCDLLHFPERVNHIDPELIAASLESCFLAAKTQLHILKGRRYHLRRGGLSQKRC